MTRLDITLGVLSLTLWALIAWWVFRPVQKLDLKQQVSQQEPIGKGWSPNPQNIATSTVQGSPEKITNLNPQNSQRVCLKFGDGNNICN